MADTLSHVNATLAHQLGQIGKHLYSIAASLERMTGAPRDSLANAQHIMQNNGATLNAHAQRLEARAAEARTAPRTGADAAALALEVEHTVGSAGLETRPPCLYFRQTERGPMINIPVSYAVSVSEALGYAIEAYPNAYSFAFYVSESYGWSETTRAALTARRHNPVRGAQ